MVFKYKRKGAEEEGWMNGAYMSNEFIRSDRLLGRRVGWEKKKEKRDYI